MPRNIPGSQPHSGSRDDRRQRSGLVQSGMTPSSRENASGLMLASPSAPVGAFFFLTPVEEGGEPKGASFPKKGLPPKG